MIQISRRRLICVGPESPDSDDRQPRRIVLGVIGPVDMRTVELLARLQAYARRTGAEIRLSHASEDLTRLLDLAGLAEVVESSGSAEGQKQSDSLE